MKKEAGIYLFLGLLAVGVFLAAYFLNLGLTGFAVFQQNTAENFNEGVYENVVYDQNLSAVILSPNQTSGIYTSKVFDAGSNVNWNNLSFTGSEEITFQVTTCSDVSCSDASFSSADLNNLNFTGQYFQYKVTFDASGNASNETLSLSSVSIGTSEISAPVQTSVSISEPKGTKTSSSGILLNFTTVGESLTCWYSVHDASDSAVILQNTTISGCSSLTFDLGAGEGSYVLNLYANGSSGFATGSSSFSVDLPSSSTTTEEEEETTESAIQIPVTAAETTETTQETTSVTELSAPEIQSFTAIPGSLHEIKWNVRNTGTEPLSSCALNIEGDSASWISTPEDSANLNAGDSHEFILIITVSNETEDGSYPLSVSVECFETSSTEEFTLNVERKKLNFDVIDAQRTRDDRVRVVYSLEELTGENQEVEVKFMILDAGNQEVGNSSQNRSISGNDTREFTANIAINETLNGSFSLSASVNSEVYTTSVLEPITLGTPVGGFAIFDNLGLGSGSTLILVIVVVVLVVVFIVVRIIRKRRKS